MVRGVPEIDIGPLVAGDADPHGPRRGAARRGLPRGRVLLDRRARHRPVAPPGRRARRGEFFALDPTPTKARSRCRERHAGADGSRWVVSSRRGSRPEGRHLLRRRARADIPVSPAARRPPRREPVPPPTRRAARRGARVPARLTPLGHAARGARAGWARHASSPSTSPPIPSPCSGSSAIRQRTEPTGRDVWGVPSTPTTACSRSCAGRRRRATGRAARLIDVPPGPTAWCNIGDMLDGSRAAATDRRRTASATDRHRPLSFPLLPGSSGTPWRRRPTSAGGAASTSGRAGTGRASTLHGHLRRIPAREGRQVFPDLRGRHHRHRLTIHGDTARGPLLRFSAAPAPPSQILGSARASTTAGHAAAPDRRANPGPAVGGRTTEGLRHEDEVVAVDVRG